VLAIIHTPFSHFFTFSNNNQYENIPIFFFTFLYYINNFFITIQIKKFITIQIFFTFLYKFFLLYIISSLFTNSKIQNTLYCFIQTLAKHHHNDLDSVNTRTSNNRMQGR